MTERVAQLGHPGDHRGEVTQPDALGHVAAPAAREHRMVRQRRRTERRPWLPAATRGDRTRHPRPAPCPAPRRSHCSKPPTRSNSARVQNRLAVSHRPAMVVIQSVRSNGPSCRGGIGQDASLDEIGVAPAPAFRRPATPGSGYTSASQNASSGAWAWATPRLRAAAGPSLGCRSRMTPSPAAAVRDLGGGVGGAVVDHDHLVGAVKPLVGERREGALQRGRSVTRGHDHAHADHRGNSISLPAQCGSLSPTRSAGPKSGVAASAWCPSWPPRSPGAAMTSSTTRPRGTRACRPTPACGRSACAGGSADPRRHEADFGRRVLIALARERVDAVHAFGRHDAIAAVRSARLRRDGRRTVMTDLGLPIAAWWATQGDREARAFARAVAAVDVYCPMSRAAAAALASDYGRRSRRHGRARRRRSGRVCARRAAVPSDRRCCIPARCRSHARAWPCCWRRCPRSPPRSPRSSCG